MDEDLPQEGLPKIDSNLTWDPHQPGRNKVVNILPHFLGATWESKFKADRIAPFSCYRISQS